MMMQFINQDLRSIVSVSWLTCSIDGSFLLFTLMYDNRKYNVNSFIGHSVVLQYVTVHSTTDLKC